jgi:hypothetical protein
LKLVAETFRTGRRWSRGAATRASSKHRGSTVFAEAVQEGLTFADVLDDGCAEPAAKYRGDGEFISRLDGYLFGKCVGPGVTGGFAKELFDSTKFALEASALAARIGERLLALAKRAASRSGSLLSLLSQRAR